MISQLVANGVIAGSIYCLVALGFSLIYGTARFFHLAHGVVLAVGAYVGYSLLRQTGIQPVLLLFPASAVAAVVGIAIDRFVYRPLRLRKAGSLVFLVASFGVFVFVQNLLQLVYSERTLTLRAGPIREGRHFLGAVITDVQILILATNVVLFVALWLFVQRTRLGKAMRAAADDPLGASAVGINVERVILAAFAIGSGLAGAAGVLIGYETSIEPTMGMNAVLKGMIASVVGGIGSIPGAILGGYVLGVAENIGTWRISAGWKDCIAFAILIVFLLVRPGGIMGVKTRGETL